jgi:hypothetical protein
MGKVATGLTTPEKVRAYLGADGGSNNELIDQLIVQVTDQIEAFLNRKLIKASYEEKIDGWRDENLVLKHRPVIKFESLTFVDELVDSGNYEVDEDAGLVVGVISGAATSWTTGRRNYTAVYTAGYETIPGGIEFVATRLVARAVETTDKKRVGLDSKTLPTGGAVTFLPDTMNDEERKLLAPYAVVF